jgi:hypothetical protein
VTADNPRRVSHALTERIVDYLCNLYVTNDPALMFVVEAEVEETVANARRGTYGWCAPDPQCQTLEPAGLGNGPESPPGMA